MNPGVIIGGGVFFYLVLVTGAYIEFENLMDALFKIDAVHDSEIESSSECFELIFCEVSDLLNVLFLHSVLFLVRLG